MGKIGNNFGSLAIIGGLIASLHFLHAQGTGSGLATPVGTAGRNGMLTALSYPSNTLWLSVASMSNGWVNLILHGTTPGTNYVLLSKQTLADLNWSNAGAMTGTANQDWTAMSVPVGAQSSCFFQAQSAAGQPASTIFYLECQAVSNNVVNGLIHNSAPRFPTPCPPCNRCFGRRGTRKPRFMVLESPILRLSACRGWGGTCCSCGRDQTLPRASLGPGSRTMSSSGGMARCGLGEPMATVNWATANGLIPTRQYR